TCDVANEDEVRVAFETVIPQFGRLDAAFNNAGVQSPPTEVADVSGGEYDRVLAINLKGIFNCMKYELQQMRKQGSGAIVNNSSLGGIVGLPYRAIYHASKHGILGLTKSAALEYADRGIRINAVCPGIIHTPMVQKMLETQPDAMDGMIATLPIKRLGTAEEIASAVLWLCGPGSTYVIGQSIVVDGGYTIQ
ncbi:MAG TPA: SDR family oxidoreductase, partial [Nitrospira sp.]|nr:SDR family oxidoreductase [Nitrospira sp.]